MLPCTVYAAFVSANGELIALLCIDGAHNLADECWFIAILFSVSGKICPCGIYCQLLVFATAVNSLIVLVNNVFTFAAVGLNDEFLHLFYCEVNGDDVGDAEECGLQDGVRAVAEANLLCNLRSVDIVNGDVVLSKVLLDVVWQEVYQLLSLMNRVEEERSVVAQTFEHVVHTEVCLNVTSHEVRCLDLIGAADGRVAEAQVRAGETARFLRVVAEIGLTVLVGVVTNDLD